MLCILVGVDQKDNCAASQRPRSSPTSAWSWLALLVLRFALCSLVLSTGPRCSASWPVWTRRTVRFFFCGRVRRQQQQWRARGWFCWLNVSHAVFPSLSAGLLVRVFIVPAMSVAYLAILSPVASRDTTGIVMGQARLVSTTSVACARLVLLVFMLASIMVAGEVAALVIDIVSGTFMAGFDGDDASAAFFVCGRPMISASWAVWRWPRSSSTSAVACSCCLAGSPRRYAATALWARIALSLSVVRCC